jgi:hypothetical protein
LCGRCRHTILFKYLNSNRFAKENVSMDIGSYFQLIIYALMMATFVVIVLAFLEMYYGKEEKQE